jgi:hypothetical protein
MRLANNLLTRHNVGKGSQNGPASGRLAVGRYGESQVVAACDIEDPTADQILVGRNARRRLVNSIRRTELGLTEPLPLAGDRLVCLRKSESEFGWTRRTA